LSQLEERRQAAEDAAGVERYLSLIISRMEDFAEKVVKGLDNLDCDGKREIVRTVVRRIEIDQNNVEVIFRVPPNGGSPEPGALNMSRALQHCTDVRRAHHCVAQPLPPLSQRLGVPQPKGLGVLAPRLNPPHAQKTLQSGLNSPDGLLVN
jgi:site-specific DNA recombinase